MAKDFIISFNAEKRGVTPTGETLHLCTWFHLDLTTGAINATHRAVRNFHRHNGFDQDVLHIGTLKDCLYWIERAKGNDPPDPRAETVDAPDYVHRY